MSARRICQEISLRCPVEATTYGYYPNLGGNSFFTAVFAFLFIVQLIFGIKYKTWTWMTAMLIGCGLEAAGYGGRILMHFNPWSSAGFKLQIVCLVLAPSFMSASIDLTLKHIVLVFGPQLSRLRPSLYTWLFIGLDFFSILLQAIGGGLAASGERNLKLLNTGNNVILAGIVMQVVQLVLFGLTSAWYIWSVYKYSKTHELPKRGQAYLQDWKFKCFCASVAIAFFAILIRCIYRIPEMAGGWGNGLQREENTFLILDGAMVCLAAIVLTLFHPGYSFDQLSKTVRQTEAEAAKEEYGEQGLESSVVAQPKEKEGRS